MAEIKRYIPRDDSLSDVVKSLTHISSAEEFIRLVGRFQMNKMCSPFGNYDRILPSGRYAELHYVGNKKERIVVNMTTFDIYPTRDHYCTFLHAGRPKFAQNFHQ